MARELPLVDNDERTRDRVAREISHRGPITAAELADSLQLTPAAIRRHLDGLQAEGLVATWHAAPPGQRGRGRPARSFVLTEAGQAALGAHSTGYHDLATAALRYLADVAGPDAVRDFAVQRVADLESRVRPGVESAGPEVAERAGALAEALSRDGYAATARPAGAGVQLCQGHCPVQDVARAFPELCEVETEAFSRLLGVHVQRLATLAHGEHVCTTYVPAPPTVPQREADR